MADIAATVTRRRAVAIEREPGRIVLSPVAPEARSQNVGEEHGVGESQN
jgi:hypothetical protein